MDLPGEVKRHASRVQASLEPAVPEARWAPAEALHCTLAFLASVEEERIPELSHAVAGSVTSMIDFPTYLDGVGAFPSERRARVLWLGLADPAGGLRLLASAVQDAIRALGYPLEARQFVPHVTLARLREPRPLHLPEVEIAVDRFAVDRVTLFRSHLGRPTARYEALAIYPFGRRSSA